MSRQQSQIFDTVHQVLGIVSKNPSGADQTDMPEGLNLPVTTIEELEVVETALEEPGCFSGLVSMSQRCTFIFIFAIYFLKKVCFCCTFLMLVVF